MRPAGPSVALALLALGAPPPSAGQGTATRPVRLLVASAPGGPSDFVARLIAPRLGDALGRNVVVDARASVNGIVATELAARATPDGYTLAIGNNGTHVTNVLLYKALPYDPVRDFAPVSRLVSAGTTLVAYPKFAPGTFRDFVALARRDPGRINIAVAGASGAVSTEVLKMLAGIRLTNVPYKGSSPTELAVLSGEVEVALISVPQAGPLVKGGRLKAYAVSTAKRTQVLPDVPTFTEVGLAGHTFGNWHGLFAPAGTPDAILRTLHQAVVRIFEQADVRDLLAARGNEIIASAPAEFAEQIRRDIERFRKVVQSAGIEPQ